MTAGRRAVPTLLVAPLALAVLALVVLAGACSGGDTTLVRSDMLVKETPTPTPTPTPSATETATPTPTEAGPAYPLTGLPAEDPARLGLPVLGVKVDNAPDARPQEGLGKADIVFEELVEGGVTRFLALFHSIDPGEVGPVRSGRDVDADIFPPFQGVLAISGAAGPTYNVLFAAGLTVFEEGQAGGAIYRVDDRPAPHNLNAIAARLWEAGADRPAAGVPWPFDPAVPAGGTPIENVATAFSDDTSQSWAWRPGEQVFQRGQDGTRHLTDDGEQISAENVVYASVGIGSGGGVDVTGTPTVSVQLEGEGEAVFLRDGQLFRGRWRKASGETHFQWVDEHGAVFPLTPGRTWVELLPAGLTIQTDVPSPSADAPTPEPTE